MYNCFKLYMNFSNFNTNSYVKCTLQESASLPSAITNGKDNIPDGKDNITDGKDSHGQQNFRVRVGREAEILGRHAAPLEKRRDIRLHAHGVRVHAQKQMVHRRVRRDAHDLKR